MENSLSIILNLLFILIFAVGLLYLCYSVCLKLLNIKHATEILDNTAVAVVIASMFLSVGYVASGIIDPLQHTYEILQDGNHSGGAYYLRSSFYTVVFSFIAALVGIISSFLGLKIFDVITKGIDEIEEIKAGNINVAILGAAIVFVLALFVKFSVIEIVEELIPYPETLPF